MSEQNEDENARYDEDDSGGNESDGDQSAGGDHSDNDDNGDYADEDKNKIKVDEAVEQDFLLLMKERRAEELLQEQGHKSKRARAQKPLPPGLARLRDKDVIYFDLEPEVSEEINLEEDGEEGDSNKAKDMAVSITVPEPIKYDRATGRPVKYKTVTYVLERDLNLDQLRQLSKGLSIRGISSRSRAVVRRAIALCKKLAENKYDENARDALTKLCVKRPKFFTSEQGKDGNDSQRVKDSPSRPRGPRSKRVYPQAKLTDLPNLDDYDDFRNVDDDDGIWPPRYASTSVSKKNKRKSRSSWETDDDDEDDEEEMNMNGLRKSITGERRESGNRKRASGEYTDNDGSSVDSSGNVAQKSSRDGRRSSFHKNRHVSVTFQSPESKEASQSRMELQAIELSKTVGLGMKPKFRFIIQAGEFSRALLQQAKSMEMMGMAPDVISGMRKKAANAMRESLGMPTAEALL